MAKRDPVKNPEPKPATAVERPRVKVRATRMGYYDHARRRVDDVFTVRAQDFSETWMEQVDARTPEKTTTPLQDLRRQHDEILRERTPASGTPLVDDALPTGATSNPLDV